MRQIPKKPTISIGLPVHNGGCFLEETLHFIASQSFTDYELIISDNASTDNTQRICETHAAVDPRITYVRQSINRGWQNNFKEVLRRSNGSYFCWSAADDLMMPNFLKTLHSVLEENPAVVCAMSDVQCTEPGDIPSRVLELSEIRLDNSTSDWRTLRKLFFKNPTSNICYCIYGLYRRDVIATVSADFLQGMAYATAWEVPFLAQVALKGEICSVPFALKVYRSHDNSIYRREQASISSLQRTRHLTNISYLLARIVIMARLSFIEKASLLSTVASSLFGRVLSAAINRISRRHLLIVPLPNE